MKSKQFFFSVLATVSIWASLGSSSEAFTVALSTGATGRFLTSGNLILPTGSAVRVGIFDTSGGNLNTIRTSGDFAVVNALFKPLAEGIPNAGTLNQPGNATQRGVIEASGDINASISANNNVGYANVGNQLYYWVFNTVDPSAATEWGIFTAATFTVPANNDFGFVIMTSANVTTSEFGSIDSGNLRLAAIPEPSVGLLAALCGAIVLGRRRR